MHQPALDLGLINGGNASVRQRTSGGQSTVNGYTRAGPVPNRIDYENRLGIIPSFIVCFGFPQQYVCQAGRVMRLIDLVKGQGIAKFALNIQKDTAPAPSGAP